MLQKFCKIFILSLALHIYIDRKWHSFFISYISMILSGEARPIFWSCYANISTFEDRKNNEFLKK